MTYPDTLKAALERMLAGIRDGAVQLQNEARDMDDDPERRDFRLEAAAGARRYAETLQEQIDAGTLTGQAMDAAMDATDLVLAVTRCAGWISSSTIAGGSRDQQAAAKQLIEQNVLRAYDAERGRWVACHRLVAS